MFKTYIDLPNIIRFHRDNTNIARRVKKKKKIFSIELLINAYFINFGYFKDFLETFSISAQRKHK